MVFGIRIFCATYNVQYSSIHVIIYNGPILLQCTRFSAILCNVTNAKDISYGYNIKCILQDKIQNKLLYLTAARVNSLNTWRAFVICYLLFLIQYILNMKQKKREYYCVHGQAGRVKQSLVHVEFTVECFNI